MHDFRIFITLGKMHSDICENTEACVWQGQTKRSKFDHFLIQSRIRISILNKESKVVGWARDVKCIRERTPEMPPLYTFSIVPQYPKIVNPVPLNLGKDVKYRRRLETLHKFGYEVVDGNIAEGIFCVLNLRSFNIDIWFHREAS